MEPERAVELFAYDARRVELGRKRQDAVWKHEEPDKMPILVHGALTQEQEAVPAYNLKECFYDKEKMFLTGLRSMMACANGRSDAVPSIRANLGCGVVPTMLGVESLVFEDKMPWVKEHLSKERIREMDVDDVGIAGDMERAIEYMAYFRDMLDGKGYVFCADIQGPFDTAHLVYGDRIFYDMYDDPEFVHHLLRLSTRAIITALEEMKKVNGERRGESYHYNELYMSTGGMKTSEDTTTLIAPEQIREFALPYLEECLAAMDGGYVHYCGKNDALFSFVMESPHVRGVNFGNPEMHDFAEVIRACRDHGKVYYGGWPPLPGEDSYEAYFSRILEPFREEKGGMIFTCSASLFTKKDGGAYTAPEVVDLWYAMQE